MKETSKQKLVAALSEVMRESGYVQKTAVNDFHKYSYATAEAVQTKFREALAKRGVVVSRFEIEVVLNDPGRCRILGQLYLTDGHDEIGPFTGLGEGSDRGDKAGMKAWTAANKYAIAAAILLSWGQDPEADPATDITAYQREIESATTKAELDRTAQKLAK